MWINKDSKISTVLQTVFPAARNPPSFTSFPPDPKLQSDWIRTGATCCPWMFFSVEKSPSTFYCFAYQTATVLLRLRPPAGNNPHRCPWRQRRCSSCWWWRRCLVWPFLVTLCRPSRRQEECRPPLVLVATNYASFVASWTQPRRRRESEREGEREGGHFFFLLCDGLRFIAASSFRGRGIVLTKFLGLGRGGQETRQNNREKKKTFKIHTVGR